MSAESSRLLLPQRESAELHDASPPQATLTSSFSARARDRVRIPERGNFWGGLSERLLRSRACSDLFMAAHGDGGAATQS